MAQKSSKTRKNRTTQEVSVHTFSLESLHRINLPRKQTELPPQVYSLEFMTIAILLQSAQWLNLAVGN